MFNKNQCSGLNTKRLYSIIFTKAISIILNKFLYMFKPKQLIDYNSYFILIYDSSLITQIQKLVLLIIDF